MLYGKLVRALDKCADAAFTLSGDGEIRSWNRAAERLFGYTAAEALQRRIADLLEPRGLLGTLVDDTYCERAIHDGHVMTMDMRVRTRTQRRLWVRVSALVFEADRAGPAMIVHLAHDITAEKRMAKLSQRFAEVARRIVVERDGEPRFVPVSPLSPQEQRILHSLARGASPAVVAKSIGISTQTLRNHLHHVNQKLGTHNRPEAVVHATRRKLI
jgi:PAS domain S-box-containing protein